jgi:hypothetical protein
MKFYILKNFQIILDKNKDLLYIRFTLRGKQNKEDIMHLSKEHVDRIFERAKHQQDYILGLYKAVIPDFNSREKIEWPEVGEELGKYIFKKAFKFDRTNHPGVLPGGAWLDKGFSSNPELDAWEVRPRD